MTVKVDKGKTLKTQMIDYSLWDVLLSWRTNLRSTDLNHSTQKSYLAGIVQLIKRKILDPKTLLSELDDEWRDQVVEGVKSSEWTPYTQTYRLTGLKAFLYYAAELLKDEININYVPLSRIPEPHLISADPATIEDMLHIETLPPDHWLDVIDSLYEINKRDAVIAMVIWEACQSLDSVLALHPQDVEDGIVYFKKVGGIKVSEPITNLLKIYQGPLDQPIFRTKTGKSIRRNQVVRNIALAADRVGTEIRVTPKIWLATARLDQMPRGSVLDSVLSKIEEKKRQETTFKL